VKNLGNSKRKRKEPHPDSRGRMWSQRGDPTQDEKSAGYDLTGGGGQRKEGEEIKGRAPIFSNSVLGRCHGKEGQKANSSKNNSWFQPKRKNWWDQGLEGKKRWDWAGQGKVFNIPRTGGDSKVYCIKGEVTEEKL